MPLVKPTCNAAASTTWRRLSRRVVDAGLDGIELHPSNGYTEADSEAVKRDTREFRRPCLAGSTMKIFSLYPAWYRL